MTRILCALKETEGNIIRGNIIPGLISWLSRIANKRAFADSQDINFPINVIHSFEYIFTKPGFRFLLVLCVLRITATFGNGQKDYKTFYNWM